MNPLLLCASRQLLSSLRFASLFSFVNIHLDFFSFFPHACNGLSLPQVLSDAKKREQYDLGVEVEDIDDEGRGHRYSVQFFAAAALAGGAGGGSAGSASGGAGGGAGGAGAAGTAALFLSFLF